MADDTLDVLRRIEFHLGVLTAPQRRTARLAFEREFLRTDARVRMFALMDGTRTVTEIARATSVTPTAVRDLLKILELKGLVTTETMGAAQAPKASQSAVVEWDLARQETG